MPELFGRSYKVTVSLLGIPGFYFDSDIGTVPNITFSCVRDTKKQPNKGEITIIGLNPSNRAKLESLEEAQVELEAGYKNHRGIIFKGDCEINNIEEPLDWHSVFEGEDGGKAVRLDRVNLSFAPGSTLLTVIAGVAASMRTGIGNALATAPLGTLVEGGKEFVNGVTVSGSSARQLNRLCKSAGLEWSIQNDALQILPKGMPLPVTAVVLESSTGLVGTPSVGNKGEVTARSLLNKDIVPGCLIMFKSKNLNGLVRAEKCTYTGQSAGNDWYVDIEGKTL